MSGMADTLAFPTSIGPFTMSSVGMARAFNAFYRNFQDFPKPNPESDENVMAGLDLTALGWSGSADIVFCQLSPLHPITLDSETKTAASIPLNATHFAWAYPAVIDEAGMQSARSRPAEAAFLEYGGYIYFDEGRDVLGTNSICPAPLGTPGLLFGRAQVLPEAVAETLSRQGRFQEITLQALRSSGAREFAWIRPSEFSDRISSPNGCFAYKLEGGVLRYFPVVDRPVFTQDLLAEELEESETWAVVRRSRTPEVERLVILDKASSLEENATRCEQSGGGDALLSGGVPLITMDTRGAAQMSYEDWQKSTDLGTLADPWVFNVCA